MAAPTRARSSACGRSYGRERPWHPPPLRAEPPLTPPTDDRAFGRGLAALRASVAALGDRRVVDEVPLGHWRATGADGASSPIEAGDAWPATAGTVAFERHTVGVPAEWPLGQARLVLDAGAPGWAHLHSKHGRAAFEIGADPREVPVPALAFGLRLEASAPAGGAVTPRFGVTRLVRLDPALDALVGRSTTALADAEARYERGDADAAGTLLDEVWLALLEADAASTRGG